MRWCDLAPTGCPASYTQALSQEILASLPVSVGRAKVLSPSSVGTLGAVPFTQTEMQWKIMQGNINTRQLNLEVKILPFPSAVILECECTFKNQFETLILRCWFPSSVPEIKQVWDKAQESSSCPRAVSQIRWMRRQTPIPHMRGSVCGTGVPSDPASPETPL